MKRFSKQQYVDVEFLDHCMNDGVDLRPISCKAIGILIGECKNAYYVASWVAGGQLDHNMESFTILKKVITKMTKLKPTGGSCVTKRAKNKKARKQK